MVIGASKYFLTVVAVQRLYESQHRFFVNSKPENSERAQQSELKKKYRSRRERVCKIVCCNFTVCAPVCWSCAGITSGGSSCVLCMCPCLLVLFRHYVRGSSCVLCMCPCLLVLFRHYVRGSSCVLCMCPCLLVLCRHLRQG